MLILLQGEASQHKGDVADGSVLRKAIANFLAAGQRQGVSITVMVFPPSDRTDSGKNLDHHLAYGLSSIPLESSLKRRQYGEFDDYSSSSIGSATYTSSSSSSQSSSTSAASTRPSAPSGILPARYSSQDRCENVTNYCSGHGSCKLRHNYKVGNSMTQFYQCVCEEEVRTVDGSTRTTVWGGPACQKRDISVEFWLLGGFTIVFVALISWGLMMLYAMGQEELPSVIGSGVSAPKSKS